MRIELNPAELTQLLEKLNLAFKYADKTKQPYAVTAEGSRLYGTSFQHMPKKEAMARVGVLLFFVEITSEGRVWITWHSPFLKDDVMEEVRKLHNSVQNNKRVTLS